MTENTLENKAAFFAQYHGQRIGSIFWTENDQGHDFEIGFHNGIQWINLTPLSSITDEDLLDVLEAGYPLAFMGNNSKKKWKIVRSEQGFISVKAKYSDFSFEFDTEGVPLVDMYRSFDDGEKQLENTFSNERAIDKLREISYLVNFRDLTTDQLISYGWVKVKAKP